MFQLFSNLMSSQDFKFQGQSQAVVLWLSESCGDDDAPLPGGGIHIAHGMNSAT